MAGKSFLNGMNINAMNGELVQTRSDMGSVNFGAKSIRMDATVNSKASGF